MLSDETALAFRLVTVSMSIFKCFILVSSLLLRAAWCAQVPVFPFRRRKRSSCHSQCQCEAPKNKSMGAFLFVNQKERINCFNPPPEWDVWFLSTVVRGQNQPVSDGMIDRKTNEPLVSICPADLFPVMRNRSIPLLHTLHLEAIEPLR